MGSGKVWGMKELPEWMKKLAEEERKARMEQPRITSDEAYEQCRRVEEQAARAEYERAQKTPLGQGGVGSAVGIISFWPLAWRRLVRMRI
jgi:hypothetical protein